MVSSRDARLVSLLVVFAAVSAPAVVYFRSMLGGADNQYIGLVWAAGMLIAVLYRRAGKSVRTAVPATGVLLVVFVVATVPRVDPAGLSVPRLGATAEFRELPTPLLRYANNHLVFHQWHADLNVHPQRSIYPNLTNFADLLSADRQPRFLVRALLDRRFDAVSPIRLHPLAQVFWDSYTSGQGEAEGGYIWKLNQVIRTRYAAASGVPAGFLARRPGPERARWMRRCFGPFRFASGRWSIRSGGGFWCNDAPGEVTLRGTPASMSEIRLARPVGTLAGNLDMALLRGRVEIRLGSASRSWELAARVLTSGRLRLSTTVDGKVGAR